MKLSMQELNKNLDSIQHSFIFFGIAILMIFNLSLATANPLEILPSSNANIAPSQSINNPVCGPRSTIGLECSLDNCLQSNYPSQTCYSSANIATRAQCRYMGGSETASIVCLDLKPIPAFRRILRRYIFFQCCTVPTNN